MSDPIEILVEITAQESPEVIVRGSTRGTVLDDGRSFSDFQIVDITARLELGQLHETPNSERVSLIADFDSIDRLHRAYDLRSSRVEVRIGTGRVAAGYTKPSTGTQRALVWTYYGFIPQWFTPLRGFDFDYLSVPIVNPLSYRQLNVPDKEYNTTDYPDLPGENQGRTIPLLFGDPTSFDGPEFDSDIPLFPMYKIDDNPHTWALGGRKLQGYASPGGRNRTQIPAFAYPSYYVRSESTQVESDQSNRGDQWLTGIDGYKLVRPSYYYPNSNSQYHITQGGPLWALAAGFVVSASEPLPGLSTDDLLQYGGEILYWMMRYIGGVAAADLDHDSIYGADAPRQVKSALGSVFYMLEEARPLALVLTQISDEFMTPLRLVDGTRLSAGDSPKWTLGNLMDDYPSHSDSVIQIDPGFVVTGPDGRPYIRAIAAHSLYGNKVNISYGNFPTRNAQRTALRENATDQAAQGEYALSYNFSWNTNPENNILDPKLGQGPGGDRWGWWRKLDPVALYEWRLRLPMGDVLPGDLVDFGRAGVVDGRQRFYHVEETELDWENRQIICRGSRWQDAPYPDPQTPDRQKPPGTPPTGEWRLFMSYYDSNYSGVQNYSLALINTANPSASTRLGYHGKNLIRTLTTTPTHLLLVDSSRRLYSIPHASLADGLTSSDVTTLGTFSSSLSAIRCMCFHNNELLVFSNLSLWQCSINNPGGATKIGDWTAPYNTSTVIGITEYGPAGSKEVLFLHSPGHSGNYLRSLWQLDRTTLNSSTKLGDLTNSPYTQLAGAEDGLLYSARSASSPNNKFYSIDRNTRAVTEYSLASNFSSPTGLAFVFISN